MKLAIKKTCSLSLIGCGLLVLGALNACTASGVGSNTPAPETSGAKADTSKPDLVRLPLIGLANRSTVPIASLTADQADTTVTIAGKVAQRAPLLNKGELYQVSDDSGSMWVLSDRPSPQVGEAVTVEGVVRYEAIVTGKIDASEVYLQAQSSGSADRQNGG